MPLKFHHSFIKHTVVLVQLKKKKKQKQSKQTNKHFMLQRVNSMTTTTLWITLSERGTYYQSWKSKDWFQIEGIENVEICKKSIIIKLFGAIIKTKNIPIDPCTIDWSLHFENFCCFPIFVAAQLVAPILPIGYSDILRPITSRLVCLIVYWYCTSESKKQKNKRQRRQKNLFRS